MSPPNIELPRRQFLIGDAVKRLRQLPQASIDCVITSPPYFALRDYGQPGQIGTEDSIEGWVRELVGVAAELRRVLKASGCLWLNVGDGYSRHPQEGAPKKSLLLGPQRLALALLEDGWLIRNQVVWAKRNPMPSSVGDRLSCGHETVLLLTTQRQYYFDLDAIREPATTQRHGGRSSTRAQYPPPEAVQYAQRTPRVDLNKGLATLKAAGQESHPLGKNPGDVWHLSTAAYRGAHFAVFPPGLVRRPLLATCPERLCVDCAHPGGEQRSAARGGCWPSDHCAPTATAGTAGSPVWCSTPSWAAARSPWSPKPTSGTGSISSSTRPTWRWRKADWPTPGPGRTAAGRRYPGRMPDLGTPAGNTKQLRIKRSNDMERQQPRPDEGGEHHQPGDEALSDEQHVKRGIADGLSEDRSIDDDDGGVTQAAIEAARSAASRERRANRDRLERYVEAGLDAGDAEAVIEFQHMWQQQRAAEAAAVEPEAPSREQESAPRPSPRIYVADLAACNNGRLHGVWLDADRDVEELWIDVQAMLAASPEPVAEDFAIHDHDDFAGYPLSEYEDLTFISRLARGIAEHGPAFAAYADWIRSEDEHLERFLNHYEGTYSTREAWAEEVADEIFEWQRVLAVIVEPLRFHVRLDLHSLALDLEQDRYVVEGDAGVHVFNPHA